MDWLDWGMETLRAFLYKGVRLITVASVTLSVDIVRRTSTHGAEILVPCGGRFRFTIFASRNTKRCDRPNAIGCISGFEVSYFVVYARLRKGGEKMSLSLISFSHPVEIMNHSIGANLPSLP